MRKLFFLSLIICIHFILPAQQKSHLPYSVYGIGDIIPEGFARNYAMGRTGLALSSSQYLNSSNPASYHTIDSVSFFFDFGLSSDFVKYKTSLNPSQHGRDLNIRNLGMGFRISRNWTSGVGIAPYSMVGYKVQTQKEIFGSPGEYFDAEITGNGGLTQFYWNNSWLLFNHLSLGVNFTYLFGNITTSEQVSFPQLSNDIVIKQSSYLNKLYADFGVQYFFNVKENLQVTLGGVFGPSHRLKFRDGITISEFNGPITEDDITRRGNFDLPYHAGGGLAVVYKNSLTITADYLYHDWSNTSSENLNFEYTSNNTFRFGLEVIPGRYSQLGYFGGIAYRAGLYLEESYLKIRHTNFNDKGITAGLGLPFLQNKTSINISYNYGIKGKLENTLVKVNYHSFMLSLTLHDWWFIKRKID